MDKNKTVPSERVRFVDSVDQPVNYESLSGPVASPLLPPSNKVVQDSTTISYPWNLGDGARFPTFAGQFLKFQKFLKNMEKNFNLIKLSDYDLLIVTSRRLVGREMRLWSQVRLT